LAGECNEKITVMNNSIRNTFGVSVFLTLLSTLISYAQPLQAVSSVDLNKYSGKWYEIASFPQRFQKDCHCTTAEYAVNKKGYVEVVNRCKKGSVNGAEKVAKAKAFVEKNSNNAKLKVQFFWPFTGKYWIIDLADDYSYAVVSHPNRKYLWILSRTSQLDIETYKKVITRLQIRGLDTSKLKLTDQNCK